MASLRVLTLYEHEVEPGFCEEIKKYKATYKKTK